MERYLVWQQEVIFRFWKSKYVLEDLGFYGEYADLRDPDSLSFENAKKNLESGYKIDVTESVQNAEKHFEKLDEFLNN